MTKRIMIMGITSHIAAIVSKCMEDYDVVEAKRELHCEMQKIFELHFEEPVKVPKLQEFTGLNKKRGKGKTKRWNK